jgi:hypothetical protein
MDLFSITYIDENIIFVLSDFQNPVYSHESGTIFNFSHTFTNSKITVDQGWAKLAPALQRATVEIFACFFFVM